MWRTVRMKNIQVSDWSGFANALMKHETKHLDLRRMPMGNTPYDVKTNWLAFSIVIGRVKSVKRMEVCRCTFVIENFAKHVPHLEALIATSIKSGYLNLKPIGAMTSLTELRLKGMYGLDLPFKQLTGLTRLTYLSITGVRNLNHESSTVIGSLENLKILEIGNCDDVHERTVTDAIPKLKNLKRLRLEKGRNADYARVVQMIESASKLPQLEILELINFDVLPGFDVALGKCTNIKSLLLIPIYEKQSTSSRSITRGVLHLAKTLKQFVWGWTLEYLHELDLLIDKAKTASAQSLNSDESGASNVHQRRERILVRISSFCNLEAGHDILNVNDIGTTKLAILPLSEFQNILAVALPTTDIKILKVPFSSTWQQALVL